MIDQIYLDAIKVSPHKQWVQVVREVCLNIEPKPLYCEPPDDLKLKSIDASGTIQHFTLNISLASLPSFGTVPISK